MSTELKDRMYYDTSCIPKRKDHREKHEFWCKKIDEITPDLNYYKFYKPSVHSRYIVTCEVTNYRFEGGVRVYTSKKSSCIECLKDIYMQIRDLL